MTEAERATWAWDLRIRRWDVPLAAAAFTVSVAAIFVTLALATSGQRSPMIDLQIYRWAGQLTLHSGDLYGGYFPHHHLPFTYPPMAALVFAVMAAIPMPVLGWLVTVTSISCLIATLWLTWGMLGYRRSARAGATLAAAGITVWLQPELQTLWLGQINLILMLIVVADLCLPDTARLKGAGVGLAAGIKLVPLIFIPYLLLTRRFRAAGVSSAAFALTIAISQLLLPRQAQKFWFGALFLDSGRSGNIAYVGNQSLRGTLARLTGIQPAAQPYWLVVLVAIAVAGLLLAARAAQRGHEMTGILACALTGLLISPVSWAHHWVWAAPALVVSVDAAVRLGAPPARWRRWMRWCAFAALAAPFFVLPEALVPAIAVQGAREHGMELVTGNLYVLDGLVALPAVGLTLVARGHGRAPPRRWGPGQPGPGAAAAAAQPDRGSQRNRRTATSVPAAPQASRIPSAFQSTPVCCANAPSTASLNGRTGSQPAMRFSRAEWIGR